MDYNRPQLPLTGPLYREDFQRLIDDFTVELDANDFADVAGELETGRANLLLNPDLTQWDRGAGPVSCPLEEKTLLADEWWVRVLEDTAIPGSPSPPVEATYQREAVSGDNTNLF